MAFEVIKGQTTVPFNSQKSSLSFFIGPGRLALETADRGHRGREPLGTGRGGITSEPGLDDGLETPIVSLRRLPQAGIGAQIISVQWGCTKLESGSS